MVHDGISGRERGLIQDFHLEAPGDDDDDGRALFFTHFFSLRVLIGRRLVVVVVVSPILSRLKEI